MKQRWITGLLAGIVAIGIAPVCAVRPAEARSNSRENAWRTGTYVAGAGTAYALARGKGTWGLIGAGATLLSYSQWKKEVRRRHQRESYAAYRRYRADWARRHHRRHHRHR